MVGKPGLFVWRINKFKVQLEVQQGTFYAGDSYVVLFTKAVVRESKTVLTHDVHFWLGGTTSQDEAGTAVRGMRDDFFFLFSSKLFSSKAYKAVELDDYLKREAVQHREVQGHESELFLSYFAGQGGIRVLEGGYESGFNIVKPESWSEKILFKHLVFVFDRASEKQGPRLLQVKGRKLLRVSEVPLARDSLNAGDVFIVDLGLSIFQWSGKDVRDSCLFLFLFKMFFFSLELSKGARTSGPVDALDGGRRAKRKGESVGGGTRKRIRRLLESDRRQGPDQRCGGRRSRRL